MHAVISAERYCCFLDNSQKHNLALYSDIEDSKQKKTYKLSDKLIDKYHLLQTLHDSDFVIDHSIITHA